MNKKIRVIRSSEIKEKVKELFISANYFLPNSLEKRIKECRQLETQALPATVLDRIVDNISVAKELGVPVCQDTGMAIVFAELGQDVHIEGDTLEEAINCGVREAYLEGALRCSVVGDPLFCRENTGDNTPAVIYLKTAAGDKIRIKAIPKGFGSENMSAIKMFKPTATEEDIMDFVLETVRSAGSNPCPPIIVGVGIGGSFDSCAVLSKEALTRDADDRNASEDYARMESELLERINRLNIGPQGFGGRTTALAVKINQAPTHIAGLPVAVNISCHVSRHAEGEI